MNEYKFFSDFGGKTWRILRFPNLKDKTWSAFNPSISYSPVDGYVVMFRSSNYFFSPEHGNAVLANGNRVKSRIWVGNLDSDFNLVESSLREVDFSKSGIGFKRGAEDGRLFWKDKSWYFTAGLKEESVPLPRIGLFQLSSDLKATLVEVLDCEGLYDVEKNWMAPQGGNSNFEYIYSPTQVYVGGLKTVRKPSPEIEGIRGGSPLWKLEDGTYLAIVHKSYDQKEYKYNPRTFGYGNHRSRTYTHLFAIYSNSGKLLKLSDEFVFEHLGVEFAAGLVISDSDVVVSFGYKDVASYLGKIPLSVVMEMVKNV